MNLKRKRLKKLLFLVITITIPLLFIELLSFLLLLFSIVNVPGTKLLKKFPAQLRMGTHEIRKEFPVVSPLPRAGQFLGFSFDPVMGYRQLEALEWYGEHQGNLSDKFLIVTFGGSTTVQDNWPKYLRKYAGIEKVKEDIVVLNAGLWGYMTFNEKVLFTSWILPMLEKKGRKKPDLVLTLDGANDIWYRILGFYEATRMEAPVWYQQYHGYHQHHDSDMVRIRSTGGAFLQLAANLSRGLYRMGIRTMPYTFKVIEAVVRGKTETPDSVGVQSKSTASSRNNRKKTETKTLSPDVERRILSGYQHTLVDFLGCVAIRDISFVAYLQPVSLPEYYSYPMPETHYYPGINYMGISLKRTNSMFTRLYCNYVVETGALYKKADLLYRELNRAYPGHFESIINAFEAIDKPGELFEKDSIHYNRLGKETIAHIVIKDLLEKGILTGPEESLAEETDPTTRNRAEKLTNGPQ